MAIRGKRRCRLHGGRSTGARTLKGIEQCRRANLRHGLYSQEAKVLLTLARVYLRSLKI
jgi:hypothetical protein